MCSQELHLMVLQVYDLKNSCLEIRYLRQVAVSIFAVSVNEENGMV